MVAIPKIRLIYLDICCFNRPFDDQVDLLVRLQTEAKLHIQDMIRNGDLTLAWSAIMDIENAANPEVNRKMAVMDWKKLSVVDVSVIPFFIRNDHNPLPFKGRVRAGMGG